MKYITKILGRIGIDRHVGSTMILRLWNIIIGVALMLVIPLRMTAVEQGYYYTIMSLVSIQIFFELGFNYVITQFVAHESAFISSSEKSKHKIYSILKLSSRWYAISSVCFFVIASVVGMSVLKIDGNNIELFLTWVSVLLFTSINLYLSPKLAIVEGLGHVDKVAILRLKQSLLGYVGLIVFLLCGFGLPSMISVSLCAAIMVIWWTRSSINLKMCSHLQIKQESCSAEISWRKDIFPFQWKIALSWISGYFIFQIMNPIVFHHQGAVEAGKLGLSLSAFGTITTLSMSWIYAKAPLFGSLISQGKFDESKRVFWMSLINSSICNLFLCLMFIVFVYSIQFFYPALIDRVLPINNLIILLLCAVANQIIFSSAVYMRAFKVEPMIWNSVVSAIAIFTGFFYFSYTYNSVFLSLIAYCTITLFVSLPWTLALLRHFLSNGHSIVVKMNNEIKHFNTNV